MMRNIGRTSGNWKVRIGLIEHVEPHPKAMLDFTVIDECYKLMKSAAETNLQLLEITTLIKRNQVPSFPALVQELSSLKTKMDTSNSLLQTNIQSFKTIRWSEANSNLIAQVYKRLGEKKSRRLRFIQSYKGRIPEFIAGFQIHKPISSSNNDLAQICEFIKLIQGDSQGIYDKLVAYIVDHNIAVSMEELNKQQRIPDVFGERADLTETWGSGEQPVQESLQSSLTHSSQFGPQRVTSESDPPPTQEGWRPSQQHQQGIYKISLVVSQPPTDPLHLSLQPRLTRTLHPNEIRILTPRKKQIQNSIWNPITLNFNLNLSQEPNPHLNPPNIESSSQRKKSKRSSLILTQRVGTPFLTSGRYLLPEQEQLKIKSIRLIENDARMVNQGVQADQNHLQKGSRCGTFRIKKNGITATMSSLVIGQSISHSTPHNWENMPMSQYHNQLKSHRFLMKKSRLKKIMNAMSDGDTDNRENKVTTIKIQLSKNHFESKYDHHAAPSGISQRYNQFSRPLIRKAPPLSKTQDINQYQAFQTTDLEQSCLNIMNTLRLRGDRRYDVLDLQNYPSLRRNNRKQMRALPKMWSSTQNNLDHADRDIGPLISNRGQAGYVPQSVHSKLKTTLQTLKRNPSRGILSPLSHLNISTLKESHKRQKKTQLSFPNNKLKVYEVFSPRRMKVIEQH